MRDCAICGGKFHPIEGDARCVTCRDAMRQCDRPTYDLVLGLLKRIEALENRCKELESRIVAIDG